MASSRSSLVSTDDSDSSTASEESGTEDKELPNPPKKVAGHKRKRSNDAAKSTEENEGPVLSHAAQRKEKKKKKELTKDPSAVKTTTADSGATKTKTKSGSSSRQNSVWVGNLSFNTTVDQLKAFFADIGVPTRVNMPTKSFVTGGKSMRGDNRGFAYVDFSTLDEKKKAIAYSEKNLNGRRLLIKDGGDFTGRPTTTDTSTAETGDEPDAIKPQAAGMSKTAQKILKAQKQPAGPTLFMGNLGFQATAESIRSMIESHQRTGKGSTFKDSEGEEGEEKGEVKGETVQDTTGLKKVRIGTFEDSGKCKGWAFIDFVSSQHATAALVNTRNYHLDGRNLVLEYASPDAVRRGGNPGTHSHNAKGGKRSNLASDGAQAQTSLRNQRKSPRSIRLERSEREKEILPKANDADTDRVERRPAKRVRMDMDVDAKPEDSKQRGKKPDRKVKARPRPGAALALAQREKVAIVESAGKKIKFD